jgi:hypothetical protein
MACGFTRGPDGCVFWLAIGWPGLFGPPAVRELPNRGMIAFRFFDMVSPSGAGRQACRSQPDQLPRRRTAAGCVFSLAASALFVDSLGPQLGIEPLGLAKALDLKGNRINGLFQLVDTVVRDGLRRPVLDGRT